MDDFENPRVRRLRSGSVGDAVEYKAPKPPVRTVWVTAPSEKTCSSCSERLEGQDILLVGDSGVLMLCKPCVKQIARCAGL